MADLSPAANAVWEAFNESLEQVGWLWDYGDALAAALRALADQVVPAEDVAHTIEDMIEQRIRAELLAIAAELES
jgi:hypothetical protein